MLSRKKPYSIYTGVNKVIFMNINNKHLTD